MTPALQTLPIAGTLAQTLPEIPFGGWGAVLLIAALLVPLLGAVVQCLGRAVPVKLARAVFLAAFLVSGTGALVLGLLQSAHAAADGYAFGSAFSVGLGFLGSQLSLGLNGLSAPLFAMAGLVGIAAALYAAASAELKQPRLYYGLLLVMQTGLLGLFASRDLFFFYFFHEFALIPTFVLIALWGRQERHVVALEMTIYLTLGAMVSLAGLIALYQVSGAQSFDMVAIRQGLIAAEDQGWVFALLLFGFGILVSLFPFHSWAPRGYAAAPAPVAMLHAGVLKKFGLYGLIQVALPLLPLGAASWGELLKWLALGNLLLLGAVTMAQRDLKKLLGYASVMHMGYIFLGIYAATTVGIGGAVFLMVAHGLSTALLFLLADVVEKHAATSELDDMGGLGKHAPVLMGVFTAAVMASIGLPGFGNFWGELSIFAALWQSSGPWLVGVALIGIVISAIYALRATADIFFGPLNRPYYSGDLSGLPKVAALLLLGALLAIGLWPRSISDGIDAAATDLLTPAPALQDVAQAEPLR